MIQYQKYWTERKYIDGVPTDEYRNTDEVYDDDLWNTESRCMSGSTLPVTGDYFTIEAVEDGHLALCRASNRQYAFPTIYYSLNGADWDEVPTATEMGDNVRYVDVKEGDIIKIKANTDSAYGNGNWFSVFYEMPKCKIYGNINSFYAGDDYENTDIDIFRSNYAFSGFFCYKPIVDASGLILPYNGDKGIPYTGMFFYCKDLVSAPQLPATELCGNIYYRMFEGCASLVNAPELPAKVLKRHCYNSMFFNCHQLKYIKCLAEEGFNEEHCVYAMAHGLAENGTFVIKRGVEWPRGYDGIPNDWTIQEVD